MIICIDIGGTTIKGALALSAQDIVPLKRTATPAHDRVAFEAAIGDMIAAHPDAKSVGISIAGVIDPANGRIKVANIPCIDGTALQTDFAERFGVPFLVANDADCFALAEATLGAGRGAEVVFGAILGTGVGGGLIVNGKIVRGAGGFAGEWGHGPIVPHTLGNPSQFMPQLKCGCGQTGCLDTLGGARGLERLHSHFHQKNLPSTQIISAWENGDTTASHTMDAYIELVSRPLALVVNVVGASIIPVGGGLANSAMLVERLDEAVRSMILQKRRTPLIVPAQCKMEPGLIGAALLGFAQ